MYRLHGAIHAYGGTTVSARDTADSVITALSPAAWYRNATGVTSAGGFASQWDDYSGNTRHLVQAVGTNQPAYAAGVLTLDGADNYMDAAAWGLVQPETIVFVGKGVTWTAGDTYFDGVTTVLTGGMYQITATPNFTIRAGSSTADNTNLAVDTRGIVCIVFNGASSSARVNDTAKTTGNAGASNMGGLRLGARGGVAGSFVHAAFEEIIVFPTALSDAEQDDVITALNNALTVF